ncbi:MAG: SUMF1/EgtB/PvdO family nonheme iron enzyme [Magnetococcales bacterium]|nr:SUMF1/EgtB/PvdO family nonheme iron enzyme [Magnetococcales bacterium]
MAVVITTALPKSDKAGNRLPLAAGEWVAQGRYQVLGLVGEGSFGQVYRVRERATGAIRAMKRARHVKNRRLFATELKNLSRLKGAPHVLPLCDHFVDEDGSAVFITDYLDGGSLKEAILARGRLRVPEALAILDQMTRALAAAHALDPPILHRDIKPSNILGKITGENRVRWFLSDWGLAVDWSGSREPVVSGTYGYTAPEVWERKRYPASDIYSLGMTLFFMLFGRPAYEGGSTSIGRMQRAHEPVRIADSCPGRLRELLEGMLHKDPARRLSLDAVMNHFGPTGQKRRGRTLLQTRLPAGRPWRLCLGEEVFDFSWIPGILAMEKCQTNGDAFSSGGKGGAFFADPASSWKSMEGFWMGRHCVTRRQFAAFVRETGHVTQAQARGWGRVWDEEVGRFVAREGVDWRAPGFDQEADHPVVLVSHRDARAFVRWLSNKAGRMLFLPSAFQWDRACRGAGFRGDLAKIRRLIDRGWETGNRALMRTMSVHDPEILVDSWGLAGLFGNVYEWIGDRERTGGDMFPDDEKKEDEINLGNARGVRGCTWFSLTPSLARVSRGWAREHECGNGLGFRVAGLSLPWES